MSIATRALTSARDRLKQAEDSYRRSTGNEQTMAKKARCVEVAEYILKAVERQISEQYNPPLTLDELRQMDGEPVWDNFLMEWCIVMAHMCLGHGAVKYFDGGFNRLTERRFYRRKPEEG